MRKAKKLLSMLLAVCMVISMFCGTMIFASAASARYQSLDLRSASTTKNDSEGWEWNSTTKTLTLSSADIRATGSDSSSHAVILPDGATLNLVGSNYITASGTNACGIYSDGALTVTGSGSVDVRASRFGVYTVKGLTVSTTGAISVNGGVGGIHAYGGALTVTAASVDAQGSFFGISGTDDITVTSSGAVSITSYGSGDQSGPALWGYGDIYVKGSTVNVTAENTSDGYISDCNKGGTVYLAGTIATGKKLIVSGSVQVKTSDILTVNGTLEVTDGIAVVTGASLVNNGTVKVTGTGGAIVAAPGTATGSGTYSPTPTEVSITKLYVNGTDLMTATGNSVKCGSGTAVYSKATNTLTLTSATVSSAYTDSNTIKYGIYADGGLTINLVGTNTVNVTGAKYGIYVDGDLTIKGSGTLDSASTHAGIYVYDGMLTISSVVKASASAAGGTAVAAVGTGSTSLITLTGGMSTDYVIRSVAVDGTDYAWVFAVSGASPSYAEGSFISTTSTVALSSGLTMTVGTAEIPMLTVGVPMDNVDISSCASSGSGTYTFTAKNLPAGLRMTSSGIINGTPTDVAAPGTATITVTDAAGYTATMELPHNGAVDYAVTGTSAELSLAAPYSSTDKNGSFAAGYLTTAISKVPVTGTLSISVAAFGTDDSACESVALPIASLKTATAANLDITVVFDTGAVSLDTTAVKEAIGSNTTGNLVISSTTITKSDLNTSQKASVGTTYDDAEMRRVSVTSNGTAVSFTNGELVILIPCPSKEGVAFSLSNAGTLASLVSYYSEDLECCSFAVDSTGVYFVHYDLFGNWENPFTDVVEGTWYYNGVCYNVAVTKLFEGTTTTTFSPAMTMNMAQLLQVLYRVAGNEDVETPEGGKWWDAAKDWAVECDLIDEDDFSATALVTREDFITMFYKTVGMLGSYDMTKTTDISHATDYASLDKDNLNAISWAVATGLIIGTDGNVLTIAPDTNVNRATVCTMLMRYYQGL